MFAGGDGGDEEAALLGAALGTGRGFKLFLGGFKCVGNSKFLEANGVARVVTAAKGLGAFFPAFDKYVQAQKAAPLGVEFLLWSPR